MIAKPGQPAHLRSQRLVEHFRGEPALENGWAHISIASPVVDVYGSYFPAVVARSNVRERPLTLARVVAPITRRVAANWASDNPLMDVAQHMDFMTLAAAGLVTGALVSFSRRSLLHCLSPAHILLRLTVVLRRPPAEKSSPNGLSVGRAWMWTPLAAKSPETASALLERALGR